MTTVKGLMRGETDPGKAGKAALLGFLGIGLACLGCCLAPVLGMVTMAGLGASLLALIQNHSTLASLLAVSAVFAFQIYRRWRSQSCCSAPAANCSSAGCGIPARAANEKEAKS